MKQHADIETLDIEFCGEQITLDAAGCLYWNDESLMVVSDLHLEKGSSFAMRSGMMVPPYDTQMTLEALALRITHYQPKTIISLGDSFHDADASKRLPQSYKLALKQLMTDRDWIWICGNHDPHPPEDLGGTFCTEVFIGNLNFKHEPEIEFKPGEIAGHLHPAAKIRQRGKSVRRPCFISDDHRLIMPSFGAYTGGLNVKDEAYSSLFEKKQIKAWLLSSGNIFEIAGNRLVK